MRRAVLVICDGLRADMVTPDWTPRLNALKAEGTSFIAHRGVYPSTTRTTSASIATGCQPGRHGLEGNCVALDEGDGLVPMSVGPPEFRDRLAAATGQTLRVPTLAERLAGNGGAVIYSNVSAGAAIFQDPDGHGLMRHRSVATSPGRGAAEPLGISHDAAGDTEMTTRFIADVLNGDDRPALAVLWQCEPDHTQHAAPLGSPQHLAVVAAADANAGRVADALASDEDTLLVIASDHGHETVGEIISLEDMLMEAGLKNDLDSTEVVVASNVFGASIYVDDAARDRVPAIVDLLQADDRVGRVYHGDGLAEIGHRTDSALAVMVTGAHSDAPNEFGIPGTSVAFHDRFSGGTHLGCAQHGGLGPNEQHPFLILRGGGTAPGRTVDDPTSAVDIAPTILAHLGQPADGMDGRPLIGI